MGRSILIEQSIESKILGLYGTTTWETGVLIGQSTNQRDYVVHLALTPSQETSEEHKREIYLIYLKRYDLLQTVLTEIESNGGKKQVTDFSEEWFVQHCRQVNRMLAGGLKVLGIFVFGSTEERNKLQGKFRQVLFTVEKALSNDMNLGKLRGDINEQIILQVCSTTKRISSFTVDVSDTKSSVHPAEVKYQSFISKWTSLHCSFCTKFKFILEKKLKKKNLYASLKTGLSPLIARVADSVGTVNQVFMNNKQVLVQEKQKKHNEKHMKSKNEFQIRLYLPDRGAEPSIERKHGFGKIVVIGKLQCQAFVNPKATVQDSIDAIKCDVIRSLLTRCQLLCEDVDQEDFLDDTSNGQVLSMPRRIFAPMCEGSLQVSDYVFKDERSEDVLNRLSDLLGVSVNEENLNSTEVFSNADPKVYFEDFAHDEIPNSHSAKENIINLKIGALISGAVTVVVAAFVKLFWPES